MIPVPLDVPYVLELRMVTETQIPVAGKREVVTLSYAHIDFEERDGKWIQNQKACAVVVEGGRVTFPDTFVASIPAQSFPVSWTEGTYAVDPGPTFVGLSGPTAELPEEPDDPRVVDQDGDGHPGVTVYMNLPVFGQLEMYVVQAAHSRLSGQVTDGRIEGSVDIPRFDQRTLGASMKVFAKTLPTRVLPGRSTFRIIPDPGRKCADAFD
jgi:hypothetical protein